MVIENNTATTTAAGMFIQNADVEIDHLILSNNTAQWSGGGARIYLGGQEARITNSIISGNGAGGAGGLELVGKRERSRLRTPR